MECGLPISSPPVTSSPCSGLVSSFRLQGLEGKNLENHRGSRQDDGDDDDDAMTKKGPGGQSNYQPISA